MTKPACLKFEDWPAPDRRLWVRLTAAGDPLDPAGPLGHLRATTLRMHQEHYGRWLSWLSRRSCELLQLDPEARPSDEIFWRWIEEMDHLALASRAMIAYGALTVLAAAMPDRGWSAHRRHVRRLERQASSTRGARKQGRILNSQVLLEAGLQLAGPRANAAPTPLNAAALRRDGAIVALLSLLPLRLRALVELELGRSLLRSGDGFLVSLSPSMTKTHVAWEAEVPETVEQALRRYIYDVRPWLMARRGEMHARLWVTGQGRPFSDLYLSRRIREATFAGTGVIVPPHFFRVSAETTLFNQSHEASRLIGPLMAHTGFHTAERHYIHAKPIDAFRDYAAVLDGLRAEKDVR